MNSGIEKVWPEWQAVRLLGEGSFGKVYEVVRNNFGIEEHCAVKVITIPSSQAELQSLRNDGMTASDVTEYYRGLVEDFTQEIALMSKLKGHVNIVGYEDYVVREHGDGIGWDIFIRMELLTSLPAYIGKRQPDLDATVSAHQGSSDPVLSENEIIRMAMDICTALEVCAQRHIVHRDIKPDNIFVSENGDFKLGDFGVARTVEKTVSGLSKKGTYTYMAPEVYKSEPYNANVDLYSLGIVIYKLLNDNREPFLPPLPAVVKYADKSDALERRMSGAAFPTPARGSGRLNAIIQKACAYRAADRYQTPTQMKADLAAVLQGKAPFAPPTVQQPVQPPMPPAQPPMQSVQRPAQPPMQRPVQQAVPPQGYRPPAAPTVPQTPAQPQPKKGGKGILILIVLLIVLAVGGVIAFLLLSGGDDKNEDRRYDAVNNEVDEEETEETEETAETEETEETEEEDVTETTDAPEEEEDDPPVDVETQTVYEAGDIVTFGSYEQDGNLSNGTEPIRWIVLSTDEDSALLLSEKVLDCQPYHEYSEDITWEDCTLREWLNDDFYKDAFDALQTTYMYKVTLEGDDNIGYETDGGNEVEDKVFVLSYGELDDYFYEGDDLMCAEATEYAIEQGAYEMDGYAWWHVRTPGSTQKEVMAVTDEGEYDFAGELVEADDTGVRPAIWVDFAILG